MIQSGHRNAIMTLIINFNIEIFYFHFVFEPDICNMIDIHYGS